MKHGEYFLKGKQLGEKDGKLLESDLMYNSSETIQKAMAETLQSEWVAIGVKLNIVLVELAYQVHLELQDISFGKTRDIRESVS